MNVNVEHEGVCVNWEEFDKVDNEEGEIAEDLEGLFEKMMKMKKSRMVIRIRNDVGVAVRSMVGTDLVVKLLPEYLDPISHSRVLSLLHQFLFERVGSLLDKRSWGCCNPFPPRRLLPIDVEPERVVSSGEGRVGFSQTFFKGRNWIFTNR